MVNLFKDNEGFNASTFQGIGDFIPDEIKNDILQVEDSVYQDLVDHKLMWQNGELVNNPNYQDYLDEQAIKKQRKEYRNELQEIKQWLSENDWKPNKIITGEWQIDDPRWLEYLKERSIKRSRQDEINELLK